MDLTKIRTIVVVMMENRSFDHMLGYRSLAPFNRTDVDGQSIDPAWLAKYTNYDNGTAFQPFLSLNPYTMPAKFDPPHERSYVAQHLGAAQNQIYPMNGFVSAIPAAVSSDPNVRRLVMSYFGADQVPISHFFAENFTICDRWFCSLPAGTQPNRLVAMSGFSRIEVNQTPLPEQELVYDWLTNRGVRWRVYHQGIPFFTMMLKWVPPILWDDEHFRSFSDFESDLVNTPPGDLPQVIFVEPIYGDSPHLGRSTDDHAPSGVSDGQEFLMQVYNAVTTSPSFWNNSVTIVTYDEHGGFFDHVSPPPIVTAPPPGETYAPFPSLGVRIPAYVISPFVKAGFTDHTLLDHTSVLKLIGEKFGANGSYSPLVDARAVNSVSAVLNSDNPISNIPAAPPVDQYLAQRPPPPAGVTVPPQDTNLPKAFSNAVLNMKQQGAGPNHKKFGALLSQI
jgi:phospholipase C